MQYKSYAKINLTLDCLKKRSDGYHEIDSLMIKIPIYDIIDISLTDDMKFTLESDCKELSTKEDNLVYKAWESLKSYKKNNGVKIFLHKNIPLQSGLAGGSSNCAVVLKALNELWNLNMDKKKLQEISATMGSDIPFFFEEDCARATGRGEKLKSFKNSLPMYILLVNDKTGVSSKYVYDNLKDYGHIDNEKIIKLLNEGDKSAIDLFENVMENVVFKKFPNLLAIRDNLLNLGAKKALLSGSGGSVFGIFESVELLEKAYKNVNYPFKKRVII